MNDDNPQSDRMARWMPTIVAIAAIMAQLLYIGNRAGMMEQRIVTNEKALTETITRAEYLADKSSSITQFTDVKNALRDINTKLDRIVQNGQRP